MRAWTGNLALVIGLGLAGCSDGSADLPTGESAESPENTGAAQEGIAVGEPLGDGSDPMAHIAYFSSDTMRGRNSPSNELSSAAQYIKHYLTMHGLTGPNPSDPNGPYAQTFTVATFDAEAAGEHLHAHAAGDAKRFGSSLFESGFYLDEKMSPIAHEAASRLYDRAMGGIKHDATTIEKSGHDHDKEHEEAGPEEGKQELRPIEDIRSSAMLAGTVYNLLGKLDGTGAQSSQVVLVMAHLDHIGATASGTVNNGADDNASGSATILSAIPALAALKKNGQLNRSVVFMWTAAEEKGLIGSQYFVDHPIAGIGLSNIVGVINMDMVGRWDDQRISVIDTDLAGTANFMRTHLQNANAALSDPFNTVNRDINSYIDRQDGWPFLNAGEPVMFLFEGLSNPAGGGSLHADYHASTDDIDKIMQDNGGNKPRRMRDLLVELVKRVANQ
jgi:hypothetical protein